MMSSYKDEWIFFLKMGPKLPDFFFDMDQEFKAYGYNLIPVTLGDFLEVTKRDSEVNVVCVVRSYNEFSYYHRRVSKVINMLLRMNKINFFHASSFSALNESAKLRVRNRYDFYSLPIKRSLLCDKILEKIIDKSVDTKTWPGGKTPRMSLSK